MNLPSAQANECENNEDKEVLDATVGGFVGITQAFFAEQEVSKLFLDFLSDLVDATEVKLNWLELFTGLHGGPVTSICSDIDIEVNLTTQLASTTSLLVVGEANVKGGVEAGRECNAENIAHVLTETICVTFNILYHNGQALAVALEPVAPSIHNHKRVFRDKVADATRFSVRLDFELQSSNRLQQREQRQQNLDRVHLYQAVNKSRRRVLYYLTKSY